MKSVGKLLILNSSSQWALQPSVISARPLPLSSPPCLPLIFSVRISVPSRAHDIWSCASVLLCSNRTGCLGLSSPSWILFSWMRLLDLAEDPCLQVTSLDVLMITQTAIYMGFWVLLFQLFHNKSVFWTMFVNISYRAANWCFMIIRLEMHRFLIMDNIEIK